jgi:hypothetical protein
MKLSESADASRAVNVDTLPLDLKLIVCTAAQLNIFTDIAAGLICTYFRDNYLNSIFLVALHRSRNKSSKVNLTTVLGVNFEISIDKIIHWESTIEEHYSPEYRSSSDYLELVGKKHMDEDDNMIYEITRIENLDGSIVGYRRRSECENSSEEEHPLLAHELRQLTEVYMKSNNENIAVSRRNAPVVESTEKVIDMSDGNLEHEELQLQRNITKLISEGWLFDSISNPFIGQNLLVPYQDVNTDATIIAYCPPNDCHENGLFKAKIDSKILIDLVQNEVESGIESYQLFLKSCSDVQSKSSAKFTIDQVDPSNGILINRFASVDMASEATNLSVTTIRRGLKDSSRSRGGYIWRITPESNIDQDSADTSDFAAVEDKQDSSSAGKTLKIICVVLFVEE